MFASFVLVVLVSARPGRCCPGEAATDIPQDDGEATEILEKSVELGSEDASVGIGDISPKQDETLAKLLSCRLVQGQIERLQRPRVWYVC